MKWWFGVLVAFGAATLANAQQFGPRSGGESAALLKCFYECKPGPAVQGVETFQEITTIMLTNQSPSPRHADVFFFNGKESCVAHSGIELSSVDLDELNVCHTMSLGGVVPPLAGLVEILISDPIGGTPADGAYAWGKNVLGKFRVDTPEPFQGRVIGVGKYECRLVPYEVQGAQAVTAKCQAPAEVNPILVEETDDTVCICSGDFDHDGYVSPPDFPTLLGCFGQAPVGACAQADINCDGLINAADQTVFTCQLQQGIPNPACCN